MNNKQLNKEFTQMMNDRNKFAKSGFTDSEDDDDETTNKSLKSPKSGRSTVSERSSLLSARSPRIREDNLLNTQKRPILNVIKRQEPRKLSPNSGDEDTFSSARKSSSRFSHQEAKLSPKSPRTSDRSDNSFPKFNQHHQHDEDRITPRSSRSVSDKDDFNNLNMLSTMKKPLNDNLALNKTLRRTDAFDGSKSQKIRAGTPTKLIFTQNKDQPVPQRRTLHPKEEDIFEEESRHSSRSGRTSARSTPTSSAINLTQRRPSKGSLSPKGGHSSSPPQHGSPRSSHHSVSPSRHDSLVTNDNHEEEELVDKEKQAYINHAKNVDILLNPNTEALIQTKKRTEDEKIKKVEEEISKKQIVYENPEKDPDVTESIEDSKVIEKLNKQREAKRKEREKRAQNQTEATKKIEEAIEKIENETEDTIRTNKLKDMSQELSYSTKPTFNETKLFNTLDRSRMVRSQSARQMRTMSSSESGQFERRLGTKYAHVKPKTQTRLPVQSARVEDDFFNSSKTSFKQDALNDSSSIRQNIYCEWYQKKMAQAVENLKDAQTQQKNDEERKAQELIDKLNKSKLEYDRWCLRKEEYFKKRKEKLESDKKTKEMEELKKKEKKLNGTKAFEQWVKLVAEREKETKTEHNEKLMQTEKQNRKRKEKKSDKPPLPFEAWAKKKESQIQEKFSSEKLKQQEKELKEKEKQERKKLAEQSYNEWLDKKEKQDDMKELNRSLSSSMSALPPFYPSSKTIPFGR